MTKPIKIYPACSCCENRHTRICTTSQCFMHTMDKTESEKTYILVPLQLCNSVPWCTCSSSNQLCQHQSPCSACSSLHCEQ